MVLRPILDFEPNLAGDFIPAWNAVEARQKHPAKSWWLISQPDHAALSGQIAARMRLAPEIVRAIGQHDAGWNMFESDPHAAPRLHPDGRPVSFFEIAPGDFLRAWTASVDQAAAESPAGGYLVSQHFTWLGEFRLRRDEDPPEVRAQVVLFLEHEQQRQSELKRSASGASSWDSLLPYLQFCDLFSLYLCSGTRQPVEFPQKIAASPACAHYEGDTCVLRPASIAGEAELSFRARSFPAESPNPTSIHVSLR